jgi:predicted aspartyl protease
MKEIELIIKPDVNESEVAEVLVQGKIDGIDYSFLLDTGAASTTLVNDEYIGKLETLKKSTAHGVFSSSEEDLIKISKIEIGPISMDCVEVKRLNKKHRSARNLVGMDILKDFSFEFCFQKNKMIINPELYDVNFQKLVLGKKYHPYVELFLQEIKANAVWDTGAGITVVDLNFIKANPNSFEEIETSKGIDSTGAEQESPLFIIKTPKIADTVFPSHKVAGVDLSYVNGTTEKPMDIILGYSTLSKANWFLDFPNKRWAILKMIQ